MGLDLKMRLAQARRALRERLALRRHRRREIGRRRAEEARWSARCSSLCACAQPIAVFAATRESFSSTLGGAPGAPSHVGASKWPDRSAHAASSFE